MASEGVDILTVSGDGHTPQTIREGALQRLWLFPCPRRNVKGLDLHGVNLSRSVVNITSPHEMLHSNAKGSMVVPGLGLSGRHCASICYYTARLRTMPPLVLYIRDPPFAQNMTQLIAIVEVRLLPQTQRNN